MVIYAVNHPAHTSGNEAMSSGGDIGLLQDTAEDDAWGAWSAVWRDVFVLNAEGELVGKMNLSDQDLAVEANMTELLEYLDTASGN